jgi:hypothetical protein
MLRLSRIGRVASASCVALALSFASSTPARANGRFPAANQLVVSPTDPTFLVLRTTFGILFSHDRGANWDWICEKAIGYGGVEDPSMGMTASSVLAGTFEGLSVSTDKGCGWAFANTDQVVDVVVEHGDPKSAFAITSKYSGEGDGGETLFATKVLATSDDGAHFTTLTGTIEADILAETIEVAASDPHRLYVSGVKTDAAGTTVGAFLVSKDDGANYTQYAIAMDPKTERAPFISAVDPSNADRVYVRVKGTNGTRLLVTDDGGVTFRTVLTAQGDLLGFALSADGAKVYIGGPNDGLLVAARDTLKFTQTSSIQVQCLTMIGTTLFACSNEASGFIVGTSADDGKTFTPSLHLGCLRGPLACAASASSTQCVADFPALQQQLGVGATCGPVTPGSDAGPTPTPDAGTPDAGTPITPAPAPSASGGCNAAPSPRTAFAGSALAILGAAIAFLARKRRR